MRAVGKFIDYGVLGLSRPTLRDVIDMASTINRRSGLVVLGRINLLLSVAGIARSMDKDGDAPTRVQGLLSRYTISQQREAEIKQALWAKSELKPPGRFDEWTVYYRRQVLAMIRLVARHGAACGGNPLESRDDLDVISELALAVSSLNDFGPFPQVHSAALCELAAQLAPAMEFDSLPRMDNAFARNGRMLTDLLATYRSHELARHLERVFVLVTGGLSLDAYRDLTFGLWSYCQSLSTTDIGAFQDRSFFNPHGGEAPLVSPALYEHYLSHIAIDMNDLPDAIEPIRDERHLLLDQMVFRRYPVWRYDRENYLCVDSYLLVEKLASGLYWAVNHALSSDRKVTLDFSGLWGNLVEDHVLEVLDYAVAPTPVTLVKNPFYDKREDEEAFDAIVLDGRHAIVFQVKGLFARADLKYSGRGYQFFKGLTEKFGHVPGAAVYQLVRNIRLTFGLPNPRRLRNVGLDDVRCVWPVVVALDAVLDFELASRLLAERFERRIARVIPRLDLSIRPALFLQVEDLEMLAPHIRDSDFTLLECLQQKLAEDPGHRESFSTFFEQRIKQHRGLPFKRNAAMNDGWERTRAATLARFRDGTHRGYRTRSYGVVSERPWP